jgi:hypothetical protein
LRNESSCSLVAEFEQLFREFGPPKEIILDNSASFRSEDMKCLCEKWKIMLIFRCAYRPSCNGIIERHHRTVKRMAARCSRPILDVIRHYNLAPSSISGKPPCQQLFNYEWRYPLRYCTQQENDCVATFKIGESVYVKPPRTTCTDEWQLGTVTGLESTRKIEVDGYPRHISDVRRVHNPISDPTIHSMHDERNTRSQSNVDIEFFPNLVEEVEEIPQLTPSEELPAETILSHSKVLASSFGVQEDRQQQETRPQRDRHKPKYLDDYVM